MIDTLESGERAPAIATEGVLKPIDAKLVKDFRDYLAGSDWNNRRFAFAALPGIARNGEAEDASLARPWLDSEYREVREAAAQALARTGTEDKVVTLLELSQQGGEAFARAALNLSPKPSGAAIALVESSQAGAALLGARHLYSDASELSKRLQRRLPVRPCSVRARKPARARARISRRLPAEQLQPELASDVS